MLLVARQAPSDTHPAPHTVSPRTSSAAPCRCPLATGHPSKDDVSGASARLPDIDPHQSGDTRAVVLFSNGTLRLPAERGIVRDEVIAIGRRGPEGLASPAQHPIAKMPGRDKSDPGIQQRVHHIQRFLPRHSEHELHTLLFETAHQQIGSVQTPSFNIID